MRRSDRPGGVNVLGVLLSRLEYADDAAVIDESVDKASTRISRRSFALLALSSMIIYITMEVIYYLSSIWREG